MSIGLGHTAHTAPEAAHTGDGRIGTGLTPTPQDIAEMHGFIRERAKKHLAGQGASMRVLYGGSVSPSNAAELLSVEDVDGALVGGASLSSAEFMAIVGVYR